MTGLTPSRASVTTSSRAVPSPWMLPPILTTTVLPTYREMYGRASLMAAAIISVSSFCLAVCVVTSSSGAVGAVLDDVRLGEVAPPGRRAEATHVEVCHEGDLFLLHDWLRRLAATGHRRAGLHELHVPDEQIHGHRVDGRAGVADR